MTIERLLRLPNDDCLRMRRELWPDCDENEHLAQMQDFLAEPNRYAQFMAVSDEGRSLGFAEASLRTDYVNGTESSPVGYLEGLYVEPFARRMGVARALVDAVANWAMRNGCSELASDTSLENTVSQAVHRSLGFQETERAVFFNKTLRTGKSA